MTLKAYMLTLNCVRFDAQNSVSRSKKDPFNPRLQHSTSRAWNEDGCCSELEIEIISMCANTDESWSDLKSDLASPGNPGCRRWHRTEAITRWCYQLIWTGLKLKADLNWASFAIGCSTLIPTLFGRNRVKYWKHWLKRVEIIEGTLKL